MKSSAVPVVQIANLDKMVHAFFYFVFTLLWFLYFKNYFSTGNKKIFDKSLESANDIYSFNNLKKNYSNFINSIVK